MEDEQIKEEGSHEELLAKNGIYAGLHRAQAFSSNEQGGTQQ